MDSDANITSLLHRLGGVYRDPQRINRDGSRLLRSPLGAHLRPATSPLVQDNGESTPPVLVFSGTIAMSYRGSTYNIPVDLYLPPPYPIRPPVVFVRPTPTMIVKPNHPHVATDGKVYMPYLSEWRPHTHTLVELGVCLSSLFGSNPPCYARPAGAPAPPPNPVHNFASSGGNNSGGFRQQVRQGVAGVFNPSNFTTYGQTNQQQTPPSYQSVAATSNNGGRTRQQDDDDDADFHATMAASKAEAERLEKEREEKAKAEAIRQARQAEEAEAKHKKEKEVRTTQETRNKLTAKLQKRLQTFYNGSRESIQDDLRDQTKLERGSEVLNIEIADLKERKEQLIKCTEEVDEATVKIEQFVAHMETHPEVPVDDMVLPADVHSNQMMELAATNASIDDVLYFLDKGLVRGTVKLDVHLKMVRRLAKRQFLARAHLMKIGQVKAHNGGVGGKGQPQMIPGGASF